MKRIVRLDEYGKKIYDWVSDDIVVPKTYEENEFGDVLRIPKPEML